MKYYIDEKEITRDEYEDYMMMDAEYSGVPTRLVKRVIKENETECLGLGKSVWKTLFGKTLIIKN